MARRPLNKLFIIIILSSIIFPLPFLQAAPKQNKTGWYVFNDSFSLPHRMQKRKQSLKTSLPLKDIYSSSSDLSNLLPRLLRIDNRVKAAEYEIESTRHNIYAERSNWLPSANINAFIGNQQRNIPSAKTNVGYNEEKLTVTQLLYDFGKTRSSIISSKDSYEQAKLGLIGERQAVMLEGVRAYLNVLSAYKTLNYSRYNEKNVEEQFQMEKKRVKTGFGFSTDVLEAKAQLQGAKALVTRSMGQLIAAKNNYRRVFREMPKHIKRFRQPLLPAVLPKTLKKALFIARRCNPQLKRLRYAVAIAKQDVKETQADFMPTFEAVGEAKHRWNVDGVLGDQREYSGKVEMSYPIFSGGSDLAALHAASADLQVALQQFYNRELIVEEEVRNDWEQLKTSEENAGYLTEQATTLKRFLELSTKERQLGRKTLLEVLVADTNYVNALSASIQAKVNVGISGFTLLRDMGVLKLGMITKPRGYVKHPPILDYRNIHQSYKVKDRSGKKASVKGEIK